MINNLNKYSNVLVLLKIFISLTLMTLLIIYLAGGKNILNEHIISNFNYISPPSPGEDFIHSPLENFDWNFLSVDNLSILEGLLKVVLNSNIIILFSVILNLIALFYRYILPYVLNFLFNIIKTKDVSVFANLVFLLK